METGHGPPPLSLVTQPSLLGSWPAASIDIPYSHTPITPYSVNTTTTITIGRTCKWLHDATNIYNIMDGAHVSLPPDERNPFDLSSAIELLRSLSWYHPTSNPDSTTTTTATTSTTTTTTTTTSVKPKQGRDVLASATLILHREVEQSIDRRNPFLDILSSDGSTPVEKTTNNKKSDAVPATVTATARKLTHAKTPSTSSIPKQSRKRSPVKEPIAAAALSAIQRRTGFLQSLKELDKGLKLPPNPAIHVFVDYSNISIGFYDSVKKLLLDSKKSARPSHHTQIQHISFKALSLILERGRPATKKVLVGSTRNNDLKSEAQDLNYEVSILQRVPKEKEKQDSAKSSRGYASEPESRKRTGEQAVDEVLIMKILESLVDCHPATIVLATGDGNITQFSDGFFKAVERALEKGWNVELVAFKRTLSKSWKKLICPQFRIILLDGFLPDLLQ
ncbi:hypothetical protein TWF718_007632 [Orbilia javanica]|uniref:NYN domain-containing protein n=1 Tax=Orbilia javanica TaxID=47235 RepID=A0AAN8MPK4_9PEZI